MGIKLTSRQRKALNLPPAPSKYGNVKTVVDDIRFDSKKEANRYGQLVLARKAGEVRWFVRQVPFHLPGGVKYLADYLVVWDDGRITIEDAKGFRTQVYILKRKLVEALYGIEITEI